MASEAHEPGTSPEPPRPPAALRESPEWRRALEVGAALARA